MKKKILISVGAAVVVGLIAYAVVLMVTLNRLKNPALYEVDGMDAIQPIKDIVYKTVGDRSLTMDLYQPASDRKPFPVMILIQGNGPDFLTKNAKDWGLFQSYGRILSASGIAAVTFNRRESMDFSLIEKSASDIEDLLAYIQENADRMGLDMNRVGIWSFSAGGAYLRLALATPERYRCLVSYYGLLDLRLFRLSISNNLPQSTLEKYASVNWLNDATRHLPIMVVTASKDQLEAVPQSNAEFVSKARELGMNVIQLIHEDGRHGFDSLDDNDRTREIIGETIDFIKVNLR